MTGRKMPIKKQGKIPAEKPTVRIGKMGATVSQINEISKQLDKRETVKVKVLKTALVNEKAREVAQKIAKGTKSEILQLRGHTFILHKVKKS